MVSASMAEYQNEGSLSNMVLETGDQTSLDAGTQYVKSIQLNDQFTYGEDYAPKVRKPYTITKQRERWTEEEHKKFLEALKLYGRAWRRIEENVGTKTAVQIRSHAQKYFSKVVRKSTSGDATEVKSIEIPPPRPKRKPMHPYPRKLATPLKTGTHLLEHQPTSTSPNLSASEQENQSPTSVLSGVGSDAFAMTESCSANGSSSPVSSAAGVKPCGFVLSEPDSSPDENGFSSPVPENDSLIPVEQVPKKLELFCDDNVVMKERSSEAVSTQSLKLFGKTVLVTDSHRPSSPTPGTYKSLLPDAGDETLSLNLMTVNFSQSSTECAWNALPCGPPVYYLHFLNENLDSVPAGSSTPWGTLYGGVSSPFLQPHNPVSVKEDPSLDYDEAWEKEMHKEGSLTRSNTGSVNLGGGCDRNWDVETFSGQFFPDNVQKMTLSFKQREGSVLPEQRGHSKKRIQGFVPYKRCLAERDTHPY